MSPRGAFRRGTGAALGAAPPGSARPPRRCAALRYAAMCCDVLRCVVLRCVTLCCAVLLRCGPGAGGGGGGVGPRGMEQRRCGGRRVARRGRAHLPSRPAGTRRTPSTGGTVTITMGIASAWSSLAAAGAPAEEAAAAEGAEPRGAGTAPRPGDRSTE